MFGWLFTPLPGLTTQEEIIDVQAAIDALESVIKLTGGVSISDRGKLEKLYYRRNKLKASVTK